MISFNIPLYVGKEMEYMKQAIENKNNTLRWSDYKKIKEYVNFSVIFTYLHIFFLFPTFLSIIAYKGITLSMGSVLEATSYIYVTFFG